jgi:hypothetical protein
MKHYFLQKKKELLKPKLGLINIFWTLHQRNQPLEKWFAKLKLGKMCIEGDRKVKLNEIAETIMKSKKRVGQIVHEYLDIQKLCAKGLPRVLTIDQNQQPTC